MTMSTVRSSTFRATNRRNVSSSLSPAKKNAASLSKKSSSTHPHNTSLKIHHPSVRHTLLKARKSLPTYLSLCVAIPVLALVLFRSAIFPPPPQPILSYKELQELKYHQQQRQQHELQQLSSDNDDPDLMIKEGQFPHPELPSYSKLAPRKPLFSISSPRDTLQSLPSSNTSQLPRIHTVFICSNPCCVNTVYPAVNSLVSQTLPPTHVTFIHACAESDRNAFHREARRALDTRSATSYMLRPHALFHICSSDDLEPCALDYMAHLSNTASSEFPHYTMVTSDRVLFEHAAIEKLWLSFVVRPHVNALRMQSYDYRSLKRAEREADPLVTHPIWPPKNHSVSYPVIPIPIVFTTLVYRAYAADSYSAKGTNCDWLPLIRITADARYFREPLCTIVNTASYSSVPPPAIPLFSFERFSNDALPAHLFSELGFQTHSARLDEDEMYTSPRTTGSTVDLDPIPFWPLRKKGKRHIMLVLPWMQMGGSEKCMLDIAGALIDRDWGITFVFTMPFWAKDPIGEVQLKHEWYARAIHISADVFDLVALSSHDKESRLFRYMIESRHPEYILISNSRWAYSHVPLIKALAPSAVVADYNHMIHMSWEGGGMPRFGANNSAYFDLHLTASHDVTNAMKKWISPDIMKRDPDRVQTCYIGTDASLLHNEEEEPQVRSNMRVKFGLSESAIVVLFAGRFVVDKGIDVAAEVVKMSFRDPLLSKRLAFVFVGSGDEHNRELLTSLPTKVSRDGPTFVVVRPPATGLEELREYYSMSDVFLLPSVNEGIALVVYESMAAGLLVITTDVGGQREVVRPDTGVLLPNYRTVVEMANHTVEELKIVVDNPGHFTSLREAGKRLVRSKFTTSKFTECVINNLIRVAPHARKRAHQVKEDLKGRVTHLRRKVASGIEMERWHGRWNRDVVRRPVESYVTIGVKTYVCDDSIKQQVANLVRSIRAHHPYVRILLGNDGPTILAEEEYMQNDPYTEEVRLPADSGISFGRNFMVNLTTTRYFLLLDDDHVFDDTTRLSTVVHALKVDKFDMVGLRVRNLPGIDEYERIGILIPRYVGIIRQFEDMYLTLCVWNENNGPSVYGITRAIAVDVLHNAFMASTEVLRRYPWRNELKVNEHMTFFVDAKEANLTVGYLPSVFVHHRARDYSDCYYKVRFREDKFRNLLPYKDQFLWDVECGREFPKLVKQHILNKELLTL